MDLGFIFGLIGDLLPCKYCESESHFCLCCCLPLLPSKKQNRNAYGRTSRPKHYLFWGQGSLADSFEKQARNSGCWSITSSHGYAQGWGKGAAFETVLAYHVAIIGEGVLVLYV